MAVGFPMSFFRYLYSIWRLKQTSSCVALPFTEHVSFGELPLPHALSLLPGICCVWGWVRALSFQLPLVSGQGHFSSFSPRSALHRVYCVCLRTSGPSLQAEPAASWENHWRHILKCVVKWLICMAAAS